MRAPQWSLRTGIAAMPRGFVVDGAYPNRPVRDNTWVERASNNKRFTPSIVRYALETTLLVPCRYLCRVFDGVAEECQAVPFRRKRTEPRPVRMLHRINVPLRVRHQPKDPTGNIAHPRRVSFRPIRIFTGTITER